MKIEEVKERLKKWSPNLGVPYNKLLKEFEEIVVADRKTYPDRSEDSLNQGALAVLGMQYRKKKVSLRAADVLFRGFIFGDTYTRDLNEIARRRIERTVKQNRDKALMEGLINEDGVILDRREKLGFLTNPNYGKPLTGHSYVRTLTGIAERATTTSYSKPCLFELAFWGRDNKEPDVPDYETLKPYSFRASVTGDPEKGKFPYFTLTATERTEFEEEKGLDWNCTEMIRNGGEVIPIEKLDSIYETLKMSRTLKGRTLLVEGFIRQYYPDETPAGSKMLEIDSLEFTMKGEEEPGVICWIPKEWTLEHGEGSGIIVAGKVNKTKRFGTDEELLTINATGIYFIPELSRGMRPERVLEGKNLV